MKTMIVLKWDDLEQIISLEKLGLQQVPNTLKFPLKDGKYADFWLVKRKDFFWGVAFYFALVPIA